MAMNMKMGGSVVEKHAGFICRFQCSRWAAGSFGKLVICRLRSIVTQKTGYPGVHWQPVFKVGQLVPLEVICRLCSIVTQRTGYPGVDQEPSQWQSENVTGIDGGAMCVARPFQVIVKKEV